MMVCLSLLYEVNGANSCVACGTLLPRSGVHIAFAASGKSRRRHPDQCKYQCKDTVVCHRIHRRISQIPSLKFSVDPLYTFSGGSRSIVRCVPEQDGLDYAMTEGGLLLGVSAGAGPSRKMGGCDRDTIIRYRFPLCCVGFHRSAQHESPAECSMFSEVKRIEQPQRVERIDRNCL